MKALKIVYYRQIYREKTVKKKEMSSFAELNNWNLESKEINNPDASVGVCCSHKVVAVGFNTLRYDASVGVLNPPHE